MRVADAARNELPNVADKVVVLRLIDIAESLEAAHAIRKRVRIGRRKRDVFGAGCRERLHLLSTGW